MELQRIPLQYCDFEKTNKVLSLSSSYFGGKFPQQFFVTSHLTGKEVRFKQVDCYDVLYDEEGHDGEIAYYRPVGNVPNVDYLYITNDGQAFIDPYSLG